MLTGRRKGRCPGARAPMVAQDGLIVRLRLGGSVSASALRAIAHAAASHGNGLAELTARANLQLRGVTEASLAPLLETLDGLGLIDADAGSEAVRNVLASPLAGRAAPIDIRPIARALEAALAAAPDLRRLPAKFGFLIDDGGPLPLDAEPADVRFEYRAGAGAFAVSLGGSAEDAAALCLCAPHAVVETGLRIARAFLALGAAAPGPPPRRMRALVAERGVAAIAAAGGLRVASWPKRSRRLAEIPVGPLRLGGAAVFGAGAAFGRVTAAMLEAVAAAAEDCGDGDIRLTPWRTLLLPAVAAADGAALARRLAAMDFIVAADDPRLAVAACGGAAACAEATTATQADALALAAVARRLGAGVTLHVSGCPKGCARPRPTAATLVGVQGLYDLVVAGTAADRSVAQGLTLAAAQARLANIAAQRPSEARP